MHPHLSSKTNRISIRNRRVSLFRCAMALAVALLAAAGLPLAASAEESGLGIPAALSASAEEIHPASMDAPLLAMESGMSGSKLTLDELRHAWMSVPPEPLGDHAFTTLSDTDAYTPGALTPQALSFSESYINFLRQQAGIGTIGLDATLNKNAAQGALILARSSILAHNPNTPDSITDEQAKAGKYACAASNLSYSQGYSSFLSSAIQGQMDDSDSSNGASVGHRRWLLNPGIRKIGIGSAKNTASGSIFTTIRVFDNEYSDLYDSSYGNTKSEDIEEGYDFIAWPASGYMLNAVFTPGTPWSISLNPYEYETPDYDSVIITVTRESDGTVWTMSKDDESGGFFNVSTIGYGTGPAIVFAPDYPNFSTTGNAYEGTYHVDVTGLYTASGRSAKLSYDVNFCDSRFDQFDADIAVEDAVYTGQPLTPAVTVTSGSTTLVEGTDYSMEYLNNVNAGKGIVAVTGKGSYTGTKTVSFAIAPKQLSGSMVDDIPDWSYNNTPCTPHVALRDNGTLLQEGADYEVSYEGNDAIGTGTAVIAGLGNYTDTVRKSFSIVELRTVPMYRLYNQWSGEHLFTESKDEYGQLVGIGWSGEGTVWMAPERSATPIWRLYNPYSGDHHYTTSGEEYDQLGKLGWHKEGTAFYASALPKGDGA